MITIVEDVDAKKHRVGFVLIRTRSHRTITPVITTVQGLGRLLKQAELSGKFDVCCLTDTVNVYPLPCRVTRIVLAKLELLIKEFKALGLNSEYLRLGLARNIAELQRRESQRG